MMNYTEVHDGIHIDYILAGVCQGIFRGNGVMVHAEELVVITEAKCVH